MIENRIKCIGQLATLLENNEGARWEDAILQSCNKNPWFTPRNIRFAMSAHAQEFKEDKLRHWLANYSFEFESKKRVAIIMAGNIPLVGLHDLVSVYLSGHIAIVKLSRKDRILMSVVVNLLKEIEPAYGDNIKLVDTIDTPFDAVIATGSNNSFKQFQHYFKQYPKILRNSRTSLAILDGNESLEQRKALAYDIFMHFGLGCRNVTKVYIPKGYNLDKLFEAFCEFKEVIHHNKYANNYDYHKAIFSLGGHSFLDNGFLLLKEDKSLHSPVSVLHYEYYENRTDLIALLEEKKSQIQCFVSSTNTPFGQTQFPKLTDYADGLDTLAFLEKM